MDWQMVKRQEVRAYVSLLPHIFLSVRTRRTSVRMRKRGAVLAHISEKMPRSVGIFVPCSHGKCCVGN